ncbi:MAG: hypothetical protein U1F87_01035 [Kiritimatiellia bacterium]
MNLLTLAETAREKLAPYGFDFIQIDDKWQQGVYQDGPRMVFSKVRGDGPYPHGLKPVADKLKALGLTPGLWWIPFGGKHFDPFFADKAHLFIKNDDGTPRAVKWGGTVLDLTNPAAADYVVFNPRRLAEEWDFDYFKLDGLLGGHRNGKPVRQQRTARGTTTSVPASSTTRTSRPSKPTATAWKRSAPRRQAGISPGLQHRPEHAEFRRVLRLARRHGAGRTTSARGVR